MQADRCMERSCPDRQPPQEHPSKKEGGQSPEEQRPRWKRCHSLSKRVKATPPDDGLSLPSTSSGQIEKMKEGEGYRREKHRYGGNHYLTEQTEEDAAKEELLQQRHGHSSRHNSG